VWALSWLFLRQGGDVQQPAPARFCDLLLLLSGGNAHQLQSSFDGIT